MSFRQDTVRSCKEGDKVRFVHERGNTHDPNAVLVLNEFGSKLGYVPSAGELNKRLAGLHPGGTWEGEVAEVLEGDTTGLRVKVLARVEEPKRGITGFDEEGLELEGTNPGAEGGAAEKEWAYSATGRLLGAVISKSGNIVRVESENGVKAYPVTVVRLGKPEPVSAA